MIEVSNLTKYYGSRLAVDHISFSVGAGEILGFLGPNGAGKSTTMNMITGYLSSSDGSVTVDGHEVADNPIMVKSLIGYLPERPPLYTDMKVNEYLSFMFDLKKVKGAKRPHIEEICKRTNITDVRKQQIKGLSKGYQQRVGLAQALLGSPPVLILDEPTVGLDPKQIIETRILIRELGKQHTIILSSHILSEIQAVCQRIIIIHKGVLVADGKPDAMSSSFNSTYSISLRIAAPLDGALDLLSSIPGVQHVKTIESKENHAVDFSVEYAEGTDIRREVFFRLAEKKWPLLSLRSHDLSLEEVFILLTEEKAVSTDGNEFVLHNDGMDVSVVTDVNGSVDSDVAEKPKGNTGRRMGFAISRRELAAYFHSPIGYVFLTAFYFFAGLGFFSGNLFPQRSNMGDLFRYLFNFVLFLIPVLTMRLFSEDRKNKTDQALLTAPVTIAGIVMEKFLAATLVYLMALSITLIYALTVALYTTPNWASIFGNFFATFLLGEAMIAIGMFISAITENQVIAAVGGFATALFLMLIDLFNSVFSKTWVHTVINAISFHSRYESFSLGIFEFSSIFFFLAICLEFILLTVLVFEKRRWG